MTGGSKTSERTGKKHFYYNCATKCRKKTCDMRSIGNTAIESFVINEIKSFLFVDVDKAARDMERWLGKIEDPPYLRKARKQLEKTQKQISGIVDAMKAGAFHISMKEELQKLSAEEQQPITIFTICAEKPTAPLLDDIKRDR